MMKKAYCIDLRLLTERDLQDIRRQLEGFDSISAITAEMRDVMRQSDGPGCQIASAQGLTPRLAVAAVISRWGYENNATIGV
jgi:hypothetical protein